MGGEKKKLVFATAVHPNKNSQTNALLLIKSIRDFAGSFSNSPIWCYHSPAEGKISLEFQKRMNELKVSLLSFNLPQDVLRFPFTGEAEAAASAEMRASKEVDILAWLNPNTIVIQEPKRFNLKDSINLGYRPVHHKLLGMTFEEPLDRFWNAIYKFCRVPLENVFEMRTQVEDIPIRPYFNAGSLILRPKRGLLREWRDTFLKYYNEQVFKDIYKQDSRYAIFVHQAILSGVILAFLTREEMEELPGNYNYPLNLYFEDITRNRPETLEACVTIRHEGFYAASDWIERTPAGESLKQWLVKVLTSAEGESTR